MKEKTIYKKRFSESQDVPREFKSIKDFINILTKKDLIAPIMSKLIRYIGKGEVLVYQGGISVRAPNSKKMIRQFVFKSGTDNLNGPFNDPLRVNFGTYNNMKAIIIDTFSSEYLIIKK